MPTGVTLSRYPPYPPRPDIGAGAWPCMTASHPTGVGCRRRPTTASVTPTCCVGNCRAGGAGRPGRTHAAAAFKARDALLKPVPDCYENRPPPVRGHNLTRVQRTEREACLRFIADSLPCPIPTIRCSLAQCRAKLHLSEIALAFRRQERLPLGPALDNIQGCGCLRQICCLLPGRAQSCPYFARESSGFQHG